MITVWVDEELQVWVEVFVWLAYWTAFIEGGFSDDHLRGRRCRRVETRRAIFSSV